MMRPPKHTTPVPPSMATLFSRLLGPKFAQAKMDAMTDSEWKIALNRVLKELERYLWLNVDTDELHRYMLYTGILEARYALKQKYDFWPAYTEAILRIALLLMGDYPDHRRRKGGRKRGNHYNLQRMRTIRYTQDYDQRLRTLLAVQKFGLPKLQTDPNDALREFYRAIAFKPTNRDFFKWYREKYGKDYALVF